MHRTGDGRGHRAGYRRHRFRGQVSGTEDPSTVSITGAMDIGRRHNVPVIVDAAYQAYPIDRMRWISGAADIVCFGGKYFGAPSSTGFLCGRADLVHAASRQGFVASQSGDRPRSFGRSMKVDRQEIVGMVVALEEWLTIDHEDRILGLLSWRGLSKEPWTILQGSRQMLSGLKVTPRQP